MVRLTVLLAVVLLMAGCASRTVPSDTVHKENLPAAELNALSTEEAVPRDSSAAAEVPTVDTSLHSVPLDQVIFDTFSPINRELPLTEAAPEQILQLRDAIPPLHRPEYETADEAAWLAESDVVLGYAAGDHAWAFPVKILNYHEIVNDVFDGEPVLISYCPLCYSGIVFDRRLGDSVLTFGNTSALYESDMVMLDYETGSYWWQVAGQAIVGTLTGEQLELLPSMMVTWDVWRSIYPETLVLSRNTGHDRDYDLDPFQDIGAMYDTGRFAFPVSEATVDPRLAPGTKVLAAKLGNATRAYPLVAEKLTIIQESIDGRPVVLFAGPDGSAIYEATVSSNVLDFVVEDGQVVDRQSDSVWNLAGLATQGKMVGAKLTPVPSMVTFWFSLVAAEPDTTVWFGSTGSENMRASQDDAGEANIVATERVVSVPSDGTSWPMFRNTPDHRAFVGADLQGEPQLRWRFDTGDTVESSAAVVDGVAFVGSFANSLLAFDVETGRELWRFAVGGLLRGSPAVVDGVVYFGADDNLFYAVDAINGEQIWSFALGGGGQQSSPSVVDGVVYFGAFDRYVYALDAATGAEVWRFQTGASILSSPAVARTSAGLTVFIGSDDAHLYALDAASGEERWRFQSGARIFSSPAVAGDLLFVGSDDGNVYALETENGAPLWSLQTGRSVFSSPTVAGGTVYVGSGDGFFYAIDQAAGNLLWQTQLQGPVFSSPAVTDDFVYVGTSSGRLDALDRTTGEVVWRFPVGDGIRVWTSPSVVDGVIIFGAHDGFVYALEPANE